MWANDYTNLIRGAARPVSVILLALTLCACALIETCGAGSCPWWFTAGAGATVCEWIVERAVKKSKVTT